MNLYVKYQFNGKSVTLKYQMTRNSKKISDSYKIIVYN
jgi:hypothetical protein